jgi:hypothetical protein
LRQAALLDGNLEAALLEVDTNTRVVGLFVPDEMKA